MFNLIENKFTFFLYYPGVYSVLFKGLLTSVPILYSGELGLFLNLGSYYPGPGKSLPPVWAKSPRLPVPILN